MKQFLLQTSFDTISFRFWRLETEKRHLSVQVNWVSPVIFVKSWPVVFLLLDWLARHSKQWQWQQKDQREQIITKHSLASWQCMLHVMYQSHAFYTCYVLSRLFSEVKIPFAFSQSERPSFLSIFMSSFTFDILIQVGILGYFSNVVTIEICVNLEYVKNWRWRYLKLILPIYVWYHGTMKMCVLVWRTLDVSVMDGRQLLIVALYSVLRQSNPKATPTSSHPFILAEQPHLPVIVLAIVLDVILAIPINKIPCSVCRVPHYILYSIEEHDFSTSRRKFSY